MDIEWAFHQDWAPAHGEKKAMECCGSNLPCFWTKDNSVSSDEERVIYCDALLHSVSTILPQILARCPDELRKF
ncbi:hypothetical protein Y032_0037g3393 [Ancylostoma ceylanicum]|uniref:Uncharacterized protein n=1 Tax=Ancylostoma ceylanicum TaxID=53326 RepID=A0A016UL16_9BILA|nr:hypothetical protein Y032_0037g3393 [Ancylostoma ceylanicum]